MNRVSLYLSPLLSVAFLSTLITPARAEVAPVSAPPGELSLDGAIALALESNLELRAASGRIDAAVGRAMQAREGANPELQLGIEDWPTGGGRGFSASKRTIGMTQPLAYPGKRSLEKDIGHAGVKLSEAERELRRTELIRDVKIGYARVLAHEQWVDAAAELLKAAESSAAIARARVEAGAAAYQEQLRAEILADQARTAWAETQRDRAASRQALAAVLGRPEMSETKFTGELALVPDDRLLEPAAQEQLLNHPSLAAAQTNVDRAELARRRARLDPYPDVMVGVAGGRSGETDQSIVQLSLSLPLPLTNRGKGRQHEARASLSVAQTELQAVRQTLQRDWSNAVGRYRTAIAQVGNYRDRILPKAAEALRLVQTGFAQGKFNFIDLIDIQRTTAEVRQTYCQKQLEMSVAQAELEALLASGSRPAATKVFDRRNSP